jgi:hypothetical protein|tara:strand:- start:79 stop:582 length:504 start_codon:yes stop_codon:yes gene_type:complete
MPSLSKVNAKEKATAIRKSEKVSSANLDKILDIQNTEDLPRKAWHRTHGKKTGLGIMAFWKTLFEGNEILPVSKKMTNAEIERQVRLEFPHEKVLMENLDTGRQSVNYYRHLYNKGRMTKGAIPGDQGSGTHSLSFRYNSKGKQVSTRSGKTLTAESKREYEQKYQQ